MQNEIRELNEVLLKAAPTYLSREAKLAQALRPFADLLEFPEEFGEECGTFHVDTDDIVKVKNLLEEDN